MVQRVLKKVKNKHTGCKKGDVLAIFCGRTLAQMA
jgi:hypothetical protein